jgi:hypothetical protein
MRCLLRASPGRRGSPPRDYAECRARQSSEDSAFTRSEAIRQKVSLSAACYVSAGGEQERYRHRIENGDDRQSEQADRSLEVGGRRTDQLSQISRRADVRLDVPALGVDFGFLDRQAGEGLCLAPVLRDDVGAIAEVAADARKLIQPLEISRVTSPVRTRRDQSQFSKSDLPLGNTRVQAREAAAPPRSVTQ